MAKQYNINIIGSLTNTDGVLSGFSLTNYATLPITFNPMSGNSWEIVLKVKTGERFSGNDTILCRTKNDYYGLRIQRESSGGHIYVGISTNGTSTSGSITGTTVLQINTTYWIKVTYNGSNQYALSLSTDGENYTSEGSANISGSIYNDTTNPTYLGVHTISTDRIWNGTIDLNECYIKLNRAIWWRGVSNITKIQLRHDTAANWTSVNPVLLEGEVGIETDTKKQKIGNGLTPWNNLAYDLGSTALQTSSDIINALGYTPVNKAGDTMTGGLIIKDNGETAFTQSYPNVTYNTAPSSSNTYGGFAALDTNLNWMGIWAVERYRDNHTVVKMQGKSRTGVQGRLQLKSRTDGSWVAEAPTPLANSDTNEIATTEWVRDIADGQPVAKSLVVDNTKTIHSSSADLSAYINDSTSASYEVLVELNIQSNNSTYLFAGNIADPYTNRHGNAFCIGTNTTSGSTQQHLACWMPLATGSRTLYYQLAGSAASVGADVNVLGYRRLGTNS